MARRADGAIQNRLLSTPSLGITRASSGSGTRCSSQSGFQLPLSGSRNFLTTKVYILRRSFQLPLSGSLEELDALVEQMRQDQLSTPSLGITYTTTLTPQVRTHPLSTPSLGITNAVGSFIWAPDTFNSLSRDHEDAYLVKLKIKYSRLSTPSLGITDSPEDDKLWSAWSFQLPLSGSPNPIPGFSGSPRLPAPAPLRTSVFFGHYLKI